MFCTTSTGGPAFPETVHFARGLHNPIQTRSLEGGKSTAQGTRSAALGRAGAEGNARGGYDYWLAADVLEFTSHGYDGHMFDGNGNKRVFPDGRYRVDAQTDWVIEYLQSRKRNEKPFFLFVSYIEPHHQNDHGHYEGPQGSKDTFKEFVTPGDLVDTAGNWREEYPDYLGCINSLDRNLGRIRDALEALGHRRQHPGHLYQRPRIPLLHAE
jgi:hypothetical protein